MRKELIIIFIAGVLFSGAGLVCAADELKDLSSKYIVYKTSEQINIDGILKEAAWNRASKSPLFLEVESGSRALYPVTAKMLWDDKYLYISFKVSDPNVWAKNVLRDFPMASQQLPETFLLKKRDYKEINPYSENFVKVYLDPDDDGQNYTEMHVNPLNTVCDKWQETPYRKDICNRIGIKYPEDTVNIHPIWNCPGMKTAVHIDGTLNDPYDIDKGWTVEMAIPFESLKHLSNRQNFPPKNADVWRVHLARRYLAYGEKKAVYWTWPIIGEEDCHIPDRWGYAVFVDANENNLSAKEEEIMPEIATIPLKAPLDFSAIPKGTFEWKALWSQRISSHQAAEELINMTKIMGCNVIIVYTGDSGKLVYDSSFLETEKGIEQDTLKYLIEEAHKNKIKVYSWFINLRVNKNFSKTQPELIQKARDWEIENGKLPRINPDRANINAGTWLCPDRGLSEYEKNIINEMFTKFDFDGFSFDYVGYLNYYACFCDYSIKKRQEFADKHPELSSKEIICSFSEAAMVNYVNEVRDFVKKLKPSVEFSAHIYPDFDLNPAYGNRLPLEYCGQTIAWFYKPFWSYGKIYDTLMDYKNKEANFIKYNKFVPFIGVGDGENIKSAERLRTEIRIAGLANNGTIMFAFNETFKKHPELVKVVGDEMNNTAK